MKINTDIKKNYSFFIIGTGATGSQFLPFLCQLLSNYTKDYNHQITVIDGDHFEEKNLRNQKCTYLDINKNKAEVLCERYQMVYKDLNISYIDEYISNEDKLIDIILRRKREFASIPVIISCVDNNATRVLLQKVFESKRIQTLIYIDSGNGARERNGQIVVGYKEASCVQDLEADNSRYFRTKLKVYEVLKPVYKIFEKQILADKEDTIEKATSCIRSENEYPQNIATNIMAASTLFTIVNELVSFGEINVHIAYFDAEKTTILTHEPKYSSFKDAFTEDNLMCEIKQEEFM